MASLWSPDVYIAAYRFAAEAHQGQVVPGTTLPYLLHLSYVSMEILASLAVEPERNGNLAVQCALLHDVLEDTAVSYADVVATFGEPVALGVLALTKDSTLAKAQQMADSLVRIQQQPLEIAMVKLADRITNMAAPPSTWSTLKRQLYRDEAWTIYHALHHASPVLAQRLAQRITLYQRYLPELNSVCIGHIGNT